MTVASLQTNQKTKPTDMAIKKKSDVQKKTAGSSKSAAAAPQEDEEESPAPKPAAKTKVGAKPKEEVEANEELSTLISEYDENVDKAEKSFIAMVEYIQENELDRATVVATMMLARSWTFEQAQKAYGKMKKIFNNQEVLDDLKAGKITLKVAREKTATPKKDKVPPTAEKKEQKFNNSLKSFVAVCKETGYSLEELLTTIKAELKSAQIK